MAGSRAVQAGRSGVEQKLIALSNRLIAAAHPIAKQYDRLARDWWAAAHKHKTGLAANLKDKDWHDMAMAGIRLEGDAFYGMLIVEIGRCYASCAYTTATPKKPAESEDLQKASVPACSGDAKNTELELKFTHLLSISVSCEKVGVELGVDVFPGLGGFAKLEIERDGVSIHMGPKGEIPVAGTGGVGTMTVKDGLYIEMGSEGIRDVGLEVGFEAGAGAQGVKVSRSLAETMKFSFLPTPAR